MPRRGVSGNSPAYGVLRILPAVAADDFGECPRGFPDVLEARVQRRETETQYIRRAEIANHVTLDERLHDRVALRVRERHVTAARPGVCRTLEPQSRRRAHRANELDEVLRELTTLA